MAIENLTTESKKETTKLNHDMSSPYSALLALVLTFALLSLTNQIWNDISVNYGNSDTTILILLTLITTFFWGVTFFLQMFLGSKKRQFLVLSTPYYIIAGFFLLRWLFKVAWLLFSQGTIFGIYFALLVVIALLTGLVVYVQRRNHRQSTNQ